MSIALAINVVLVAAAGITTVGLIGWTIVGQGRGTRRAASTARIRRPLLVVGFACCLAILASPAAATGTGAIAGKVTNNAASPAPLANLCVYAYDASTGKSAGSTKTSATGQYTVSGLATGSYKVEFYDCSGAGYVTQFYWYKPNLATAGKVSVTAPGTTAGINAKMALGAKIKGTLTNNAASPAPLANICVLAFPPSGYSAVAYAQTNLAGQYTLAGLPTGSYKVEFYDCTHTFYITQYYDNQPNIGNAKLIAVTAPNATSGINAKLVRGGNISGTVTNNAASPAPPSEDLRGGLQHLGLARDKREHPRKRSVHDRERSARLIQDRVHRLRQRRVRDPVLQQQDHSARGEPGHRVPGVDRRRDQREAGLTRKTRMACSGGRPHRWWGRPYARY
jgi:hypothetical protein